MPWEETDEYIRSGHRSKDDFQEDSFRTITIDAEKGIKAVIGKPVGEDTTEVQSYLFAKDKDWTLEKAKAWFEEHRESKVKEHISAILPFKVLEKIVDKPLRIRGIAMTAGMSRNFNIYTPEELQAFTNKLVAAPVYIEHVAVPNAVGKVVKTGWDEANLWYEAEIYDDETAAKIRKGLIQHVSVGADYETLDIVDGQVPHGLHNAELSLVAVPGIPETNVQIMEKLRAQKKVKEQDEYCVFCGEKPAEIWIGCCLDCFKKLPGISESKKKELLEKHKMREQQAEPILAGEYVLGFFQDVALFLPEHFRTVWLDKENGILAVFGKLRAEPETERVHAIFFAKEKMWDQTKIQDWLSIHPDYMAPAGVSETGTQLKGRENMKKKVKEQNGEGNNNDGNGGQNLTVDEIKAKIIQLAQRRAEISSQLYPEPETSKLTPEQRVKLEAEQEAIWAEIGALEKALAELIVGQVGATLGEGYQVVLELKLKEAEWDTEYINNLPDSSFAFIEEGGEKDEEGRTKPRSLRHLPFKDAQGNINKAHLDNALGRLPQTDLGDEAKAAAKKKLCAAVKTWNGEHPDDQITSDVCGVEPSGQGSSETLTIQVDTSKLEAKIGELVSRVKKLEEALGGTQGNLAESLLKKSKEPSITVKEAVKILEGLLPSPMVERSSMGMQRECQAIRNAILKLKELLKNG